MESLSDTWERFKELLRSCPHHGLPRDVLIRTFYNGVTQSTRDTIDAAAKGSLMRKTVEAAFALFERCLGEIGGLYFRGGGVSTELGGVAVFGGDGDDLRAVARKRTEHLGIEMREWDLLAVMKV